MTKYENDFFIVDYKAENTLKCILDELLENGQAFLEYNRVFITWDQIHSISRIEQSIIGLPESYPFDIKVITKNVFVSKEFDIEYGFFEYNHGNQIICSRAGSVIITNTNEYLLSLEQYRLCNAIEEFNGLKIKEFHDNLRKFKEIKELSKQSAAILDSVFDNQEIIVPKMISIEPSINNNNLIDLNPSLKEFDDINQMLFHKKLSNAKNVKKVINFENRNNKKYRIVLNNKQQNELEKIKKKSNISISELNQILEQGQLIFDTDIVDLSNFSDRVIELGLYKPKLFPFVMPLKSEWIPGFIIDDGTKQVKFRINSIEEFNEVEDRIISAEKNNEQFINLFDQSINVNDLKKMMPFFKRQLKNPNTIQDSYDDEGKKRYVLIIKENLFENEYTAINHEDTKLLIKYSTVSTLKKMYKLFSYQEEGIAWLQTLYCSKYSGALLADDMGLGKTIQMLCFIEWHSILYNHENKPYLFIAPVSLLQNWENEFLKFFDSKNKISVLSSSDRTVLNKETFLKSNIFLTNYEYVKNYSNQIIFGQVDWACVIIDEAQKIKAPGTIVTNVIKALKADFKIASTGTPVENSMLDLWSIIDFVAPGLLGCARVFSMKYQSPISKNISDFELESLGIRLRDEIGDYFKRRLKIDVLNDKLPPKHEIPIEYEMPTIQKDTYLQELEFSKQRENKYMLPVIINLKKISDHPYLLNIDWRMKSVDELINSSAKISIVINKLQEIRTLNEKAIIFAELKESQKLLHKVICEFFSLKKVSIVNGDTLSVQTKKNNQKETRQGAIDEFSKEIGFSVIIMSPLAAGVGLNVTAANHIIHFSRHWNPAKEAQATDRAYRIGQEKPVYVYYPIATYNGMKTFDQILAKLLMKKRDIADSAMFPSSINEVKAEDFADELDIIESSPISSSPLTFDDFDALEPFFFESAIATIFKCQGYKPIVTPKANDKGADIICFSDNCNLLIQVKKSKNLINSSPIGEILTAKGFYDNKYHLDFKLLIVTNSYLNENAQKLAIDNFVIPKEKDFLEDFLANNKIFMKDIIDIEKKRITQV